MLYQLALDKLLLMNKMSSSEHGMKRENAVILL